MFEANNPEINIEGLMDKIREEVAKRQGSSLTVNSNPSVYAQRDPVSSTNIPALLNDAESRAQPRTKWPNQLDRFPFNRSKGLQKFAFKLLEFFTRDQRVINFSIIQAFREFMTLNRQLTQQVAALEARVNEMGDSLRSVNQQIQTGSNRLKSLNEQVHTTNAHLYVLDERVNTLDNCFNTLDGCTKAVGDRLQVVDSQINAVEQTVGDRLQAVDSQINAIEQTVGDRLQAVDSQINAIEQTVGDRLQLVDSQINGVGQTVGDRLQVVDSQINAIEQTVGDRLQLVDSQINAIEQTVGDRLQLVDSQINAVEQTVGDRLQLVDSQINGVGQTVGDRLQVLQAVGYRIETVSNRINRVEQAVGDRIETVSNRINAVEQAVGDRLHQVEERNLKNDSYLKQDLTQQKRLITFFLEEARQRLPEPFNQEQLQTFIKEEDHLLDPFYVAFEDQFRGSREDIFDRLKVYLPLIAEANVGTPDAPILDVGCGRGEWLELLREAGYVVRGLDINKVMLEQCRTRALEVCEADVIAYLRTLPDASLGAITGFHIIEHLPFTDLIKLFEETVRVLKPSGIAIFETPNPDNVLVATNTFYIDPTHRNPLPSSMIKFMAESRGLYPVKIMNLHPCSDQLKLTGSDLAERFSNYFYGPQDYAVIGYKP